MSIARWQRNIEQIALHSMSRDNRVIGLTATRRGAGVSVVSHHLSRALVNAGSKTLLLDASIKTPPSTMANMWRPNAGNIQSYIQATAEGHDLLQVCSGPDGRGLFSNLQRLRNFLDSDLGDYGHVVIDIAPLLEDTVWGINPIAACRCCDNLLLIVAMGLHTRHDIAAASEMLNGVGVKLTGIVANDFYYRDPIEEITSISRLFRRQTS